MSDETTCGYGTWDEPCNRDHQAEMSHCKELPRQGEITTSGNKSGNPVTALVPEGWFLVTAQAHRKKEIPVGIFAHEGNSKWFAGHRQTRSERYCVYNSDGEFVADGMR